MGREIRRDGLKKKWISASRKQQLQQAREKRNNKENSALVTDIVPLNLPRSSSGKVKVLKTALTQSHQARIAVESKLQEVHVHLNQANERAERFKKLLRLERQNARRSKDRLLKVLRRVDELKGMGKEQSGELACAQRELDANRTEMMRLTQSLMDEVSGATLTAEEWRKQWVETGNRLRESRKTVRALKMTLRRATASQINSALTKRRGWTHLGGFKAFDRGAYTPEARALARYLVQCGCSRATIGMVIQKVVQLAGSKSNRAMSHRSVGRALIEGGVASRIQLGYEIKNSQALTISNDGTTHRNVNYESRFVELKTPLSYTHHATSTSPTTPPLKQHARLISVSSAVSHTSNAQVDGWRKELTHLAETYSQSPLAKRSGMLLNVDEIVIKTKGMHTDHAADQKKTFAIWKEWKHDAICRSFGFEQIERMRDEAPNALSTLLLNEMSGVVERAGGGDKWDVMDPVARQPLLTEMMANLAHSLGTPIYDGLSSEEKHSIDLFFWAGCSMHKELNSVKGGNAAMMKWWSANDVAPPVLLANKDNHATLQLAEISSGSAAAVQRALESSSRGGVKAANLAGAIFNHKDDKKGQQDIHRLFFMEYKGGVTKKFPDTSNTRYHSHCDAATELLKYLEFYIQFLHFIRLNKTNSQLNHMEENLLMALRDPPTLTELTVLMLYSQAITKPYMRDVRSPNCKELNILELGPVHERLKDHISHLIEKPELLLMDRTDSYILGSLGGQPWDDPPAMKTVIAMSNEGRLPHLKEVLVTFLRGALETWQRFTSEFAAGGLIATSTAAERDLASMPPTNDLNEGMLGSFRRHAREKPSTTVAHFSDQAAFSRNGTQDFMDAMFTADDHAHIRCEARRIDSSNIEKRRREQIIKHKQDTAATAQKKADDKLAAVAAKDTYFSSVQLVLDANSLERMRNHELDDQIELHRRLGVERKIPLKSRLKNKAGRLSLILRLFERHVTRFQSNKLPHDDELDEV